MKTEFGKWYAVGPNPDSLSQIGYGIHHDAAAVGWIVEEGLSETQAQTICDHHNQEVEAVLQTRRDDLGRHLIQEVIIEEELNILRSCIGSVLEAAHWITIMDNEDDAVKLIRKLPTEVKERCIHAYKKAESKEELGK